MGIFSKHEGAPRPLGQWVIIAVIGLVVLQIIGYVAGQLFGKSFYLGPGFLLIAIAAALSLAFVFVINVMKGRPLEKKEIIVVIIVFAVTILAVIFIRQLVPEIFETSSMSMRGALQSIVGLP